MCLTPSPYLKYQILCYFRAQTDKREIGWVETTSSSGTKNEHEMLGKMGDFATFSAFFGGKNKQKCVFDNNHENIIFQDMLDSPPNRRLRMGF